ncbi:MAG: FAD-dependent oxidoreductase, partial [Clostridia bacterium]|nr:FAD-dependent oxidoreductase [Clostridia bacterium]
MAEISVTFDMKVDDRYDIIVVGGGPSGCTAAAAAAREGKKVLLIEATGALGGMGTSGLVPAWCPFSDKEKMVYRSLAETVFLRLRARMAPEYTGTHLDWVNIDAEKLKRVYDELVTENGADVRFNTRLCGVQREGDKITHLITVGIEGMTAWKAKTFIDCTGDAALAYAADAEILENHSIQWSTHCFTITNVNVEAYKKQGTCHAGNPNSPIHAIVRDGKYPDIIDTHCCTSLVGPSTLTFNAGHMKFDTTDPQAVSNAYIQGRKIAESFLAAFKEYAPDVFSDAFLVQTAPLMGIRQSRRVKGDYVLTKDDYLARRTFPDEIARNCYYLDIHGGNGESCRYGKGESHGIPYRCLTPVGLSNLLVAGR